MRTAEARQKSILGYRKIVARLVETSPNRELFSWAWQEIVIRAKSIAQSDIAAVFIIGPNSELHLQCSVGFTDHDQILLFNNPPKTSAPLFISAKESRHISYLSDQERAESLLSHVSADMEADLREEAALTIVRQGQTIGMLYLSWKDSAYVVDKNAGNELRLLAVAAAMIWALTAGIEHELDAVIDQCGQLTEAIVAQQTAISLRNSLASRLLLVFRPSSSSGLAHCTVIEADGSMNKISRFDTSATKDAPNTIVKSILSGKAIMLNNVSKELLAKQLPPIVWSSLLAKGRCWCGVPVYTGTVSQILGALLLCDPYVTSERTGNFNVIDLRLLTSVARKLGQYWSRVRTLSLSEALDSIGSQLLEVRDTSTASEMLLSNVLELFPARVAYVFIEAGGEPEILARYPEDAPSLRPILEIGSGPVLSTGIPRHLESNSLVRAASELYASQGDGSAESPKILLLLLSPLLNAYTDEDLWYIRRVLSLMIQTLRQLYTKEELRERKVNIERLQSELSEEQRLHALRVSALGRIHLLRNYSRSALKRLDQLRFVSRIIRSDKVAYQYDTNFQELKNTLCQIQDLANNLTYRVPPPKFELVNMHRLLLDMVRRTQWTSRDGEEIQPQIRVDKELPSVNLDPSHVSRAISNMVKNSAEAGAKQIIIESCLVERESPDGKEGTWLRVSIKDNGCGIPRQIQDHIFDFGFSTKRVTDGPQGSGIGLADTLAVVRDIHGGWIELAVSAPYRETTFHLYFSLLELPKARIE